MDTPIADAPVRWLDEREQGAWRAMLQMHDQLMSRLGRELQDECGLSNPDFAVLVALSEHPDQRMRILELARGLAWEKSRLSHQLRRMQQRGLLERSDCSIDRRGAYVVLTDAGRVAIESAAPRHVGAVRQYVFDHLSAEQVDTLTAVAHGVLDRLGGTHFDAECSGADVDQSDDADMTCDGGADR